MVGGGPVAARRAHRLVAAGARVTLVAPDVVDTIAELADRRPASEPAPALPSDRLGSLEIARRPYRNGEAAHYELVVTATGRTEVDGAVVADAIGAGVMVNSADRASPGTIQLPAVHRDGPVMVAVSTGGTSPALAQWLRRRIVASLPTGVGTIAMLVDEARTAMRSSGRPTGSVDWMTVLDEQVAPLVAAGRVTEARQALLGVCVPETPP